MYTKKKRTVSSNETASEHARIAIMNEIKRAARFEIVPR